MAGDDARHLRGGEEMRGDASEQKPLLDPAEEELYAGTKIDSEEEALASEEALEEALDVGGVVLPEDTDVQGMVYTRERWRVLPEQKADFIAAWHELGAAFQSLAHPPTSQRVLVQSLEQPELFYSFTSWPSRADIEAMRQDAGVQAAVAALHEHCTETATEMYRMVADAGSASG